MPTKTLLISSILSAALISNAHVDNYFNKFFVSDVATGEVTLKLSGFCSGSITLALAKPYAQFSVDENYADVYFQANAPILNNDIGSSFFTNLNGSSVNVTAQKAKLTIKAKTSATQDGLYPSYNLKNTELGDSVCKNGETFRELVERTGHYREISWDKGVRHSASFSLQGSSDFNYRYSQRSSGLLDVPVRCGITGSTTDNIATDNFKANCKLTDPVKLSISTRFNGVMNSN